MTNLSRWQLEQRVFDCIYSMSTDCEQLLQVHAETLLGSYFDVKYRCLQRLYAVTWEYAALQPCNPGGTTPTIRP